MKKYRALILALCLPVLAWGPGYAKKKKPKPATATFIPLGPLAGGAFHTYATGVSDDGQVVVGYTYARSNGAPGHAFRWTPTGGMQFLPLLPGAASGGAADVSADGQVVVGKNSYDDATSSLQAFRWTSTGGTVGLGTLPGAENQWSEAFGVSPDGAFVVGVSENQYGAPHAFRWSTATGMEAIPQLRGGQFSYAEDVSDGGNTVVGWSGRVFEDDPFFFHHRHAFRWTPETGPVDLHPAAHAQEGASNAFALSPDGRFVVGEIEIFAGFFWSPTQPTTELPRLPTRPQDDPEAAANGVSADGGRIVGNSLVRYVKSTPVPIRAGVVWDGGQIQELQKLLVQHNVKLGKWYLTDATAVSADGRFIVGHARTPQGQEAGWIVNLPR